MKKKQLIGEYHVEMLSIKGYFVRTVTTYLCLLNTTVQLKVSPAVFSDPL